ncbi:uncharacterized protein LOC113681093 [Pocillopora damicornis]|uniref:uncharacterized protein LOC113681093 n=1 Tax=Pocillopora damicornis TaxID=46731 RepID=UPI000F557D08|nr:uncharacterized protein LOC113681093 [Pocillopora damicornis]
MRDEIPVSKSSGRSIPYKDWATTVKDAKARQISVSLPPNLKNYFENALKKPTIFGGDPAEAHARRKSQNAGMERRTILSHVNRNKPHPRIFFPFQTGDRLQTYMVWIPEDQTSICSLPPVPQRRIDRTPPSRKCNSRMNGNFGQFIGLNQTTYQEEISQTPFRHRPVNMVDHFPSSNSNKTTLHRLKVW